jgi:hypothetical protein
MQRLLLLALLLVLSIPAIAGEKAPLPTKLATAKTVFLVNDGVAAKLFDKVYSELTKWNRFRLVESNHDADIVLTLSRGAASGAFVGTKAIGLGAVASDISLRITDSKDDTPLWADSIDGGHSAWYAGGALVSHLRKRMDNK